jgi:hypothetical protein
MFYNGTAQTILCGKLYACRTRGQVKPVEAEARLKIFDNSVRTTKKTPHFTITKINWLTLFKEIIAVYSENHTKHL